MHDFFKSHITHVQTDQIRIKSDSGFVPWLKKREASLALTTYQAGKILFFSANPNETLSIYNRNFERCMALSIAEDTLYLSSLFQLWSFRDVLGKGDTTSDGFDAVYAPRFSWITGDLDIHTIIKAAGHEDPLFVNTLFSCIARPSQKDSFVPLWQPPFISKLAPEDRCHLNGLTLRQGVPRYVSAVSRTDSYEAWRDHRKDGGIVMDIQNNDVICEGLSMPHNPHWHNDNLYLLQAGTGEFGIVDLEHGGFVPKLFIPGYLRGLEVIENYAILGVSQPRHNKTFSGLELDDNLEQHGMDPVCGLVIIDLIENRIIHGLWFEGIISEVYDVAVLPGKKKPSMVGVDGEEIRRVLSIGEAETFESKTPAI